MIAIGTPPVSAIADVLALWGGDGWLTPPLQPAVGAPSAVAGRALTITITMADTGPGLTPIYDVLSADLTGRVLVLAGATAAPGAVWGEILTRAARQQGASAVLVDGWIRDVPALEALGLPVYATGRNVAGPGRRAHISAVDAAVHVNAAMVTADDLVVVDDTGCVRLPAASAAEVLDAARRYAAAEDLVCTALEEGEPLARAYRHKKSIVDELRR